MSGLDAFRDRIDEIDDELARLLGERFDVCREVARYKRDHGLDVMQPDRVEQVTARYAERGARNRVPADFTTRMVNALIDASCSLEEELVKRDGATDEAE